MLEILETPVTVLHVVVCLFVVLIVLLQPGKSGGLGAALGGAGAQQVFGGRGAGNFLSRLTWIAAGLFFATSMILAYVSSSTDDSLAHKSGTAVVTPAERPKAPAEEPAVPAAPDLEGDPAAADQAAADQAAADQAASAGNEATSPELEGSAELEAEEAPKETPTSEAATPEAAPAETAKAPARPRTPARPAAAAPPAAPDAPVPPPAAPPQPPPAQPAPAPASSN